MTITQHKTSVHTAVLIGLAVVAAIIGWKLVPHVSASSLTGGDTLVTVHDRGVEKGFITNAKNLRDAFEQQHISLDTNDMVEPGLDEELTAKNYQVNVYRARPVVIVDGNVQQLVMSAHQTPKQIAKHAGIELRSEDEAETSLTSNMIRDGASVRMTIDRALGVTLTLYGKSSIVYTQAKTVGDLLKEKNITLGPNDDMSAEKTVELVPGSALSIWRNGKQTITNEEPVPFESEKINDATKEVGYKQVNTPGKLGKKMVTYEIVMKDGVEVSRKAIQSVVTTQPEKQVETVGTKMSNSFSGSFAQALARLRSCEGSYTSNTGNGYYGAYQYDKQTWGNFKGYPHAAAAPPNVQDEKAWITYQARGWSPWPSCSRSLGLQDTYR